MSTHYQVLGVAPDADYQTIKTAYRRAVKAYHPDLNAGSATAERQSKRVIAAHAVLKDPRKRARYDEHLWRRHRRTRLFLLTIVITMGLVGGSAIIFLGFVLKPEARAPLARITGGEAARSAGKDDRLPGPAETSRPQPAENAAAPDNEKTADHAVGRENVAELKRAIDNAEFIAHPPEDTRSVETPDDGKNAELAAPPPAETISPPSEPAVPAAETPAHAADLVTGALPEEKTPASQAPAEAAAVPAEQPAPVPAAMTGTQPSAVADTGQLIAAAPQEAQLARVASTAAAAEPSGKDPAAGSEAQRDRRSAAGLVDKGELDKALAYYDAAIRLDDTSITAFHERGLLWWRQGDSERALADLDQAIRMSFSDPDIYRDRGVIWLERGNYDRAIADLNRAVDLRPDFANAFFWRGVAERRKGDFQGALIDLEQAIRLDPNFQDARRNRDLALMEQSSPDADSGGAGRRQ